MNKFRKDLNRMIFDSNATTEKVFNWIVGTSVIASIAVVILGLVHRENTSVVFVLRILEWVFTGIFTIEYALRLYAAKELKKYALNPFGIVDLVSILPTYLELVIPAGSVITILRLFKIVRIIRIVKLIRFFSTTLQERVRLEIENVVETIQEFIDIIRREKLFRLLLMVVIGVIIFSAIVWRIEKSYQNKLAREKAEIVAEAKAEAEAKGVPYNPEEEPSPPSEISKSMDNFWDVLWWGFVTLTTVGYGDITTDTYAGRIIAVALMFFGIIIVSTLTGTVASILVDIKIKEGQGLKELKLRNHIVLLGWNPQAEVILENFPKSYTKDVRKIDLVLLNELEMETINSLRSRYETNSLSIFFVRGNPTHVDSLRRASIMDARSAIIISDTTGGSTRDSADEKTIVVSSTIRDLAPKVKVVAQLMNKENINHLKRAGVEAVIIESDFTGYLLSNAPFSPGIPMLAREIMTFDGRSCIGTERFPSMYYGEKFMAVNDYYITQDKILLGVLTIEKEIGLNDIAGGNAGLDVLIREKFGGLENEYFGEGETISINVNPGYEYVIQDDDFALVLARRTNE